MLSVGSIIRSSYKENHLGKEEIDHIIDNYNWNEFFNIAWDANLAPWTFSSYATLNLVTGEIEGNDMFSMKERTPYLILFKVKLESLRPEEILNELELKQYQSSEQPLSSFCLMNYIPVKQRAEEYYCSKQVKFRWYWEVVLEESLTEWLENKEKISVVEGNENIEV